MMNYYKIISGNFIMGVGIGYGELIITESEYNSILECLKTKPTSTETVGYRLRTDLLWEAYEIEPKQDPEPTEFDKAEAYDILVGEAE